MLGQVIATIDVQDWQAAGAFALIVAGQAAGLIERVIRYKKERDARREDLDVNREMLGNLIHLNETTQAQNGKLDMQAALMQAYHESVKDCIAGACKAIPPKPKNDPKIPILP